MALAPAVITLKTARNPNNGANRSQKLHSLVTQADQSGYVLPENLTFSDVSTGKNISRSIKSLIYSLTGAAIDSDFTPDEVKALSIAIHTQLCRDNNDHSLKIDTSDSSIFLSPSDLDLKFGSNYTTMRSYCDNVYSKIIVISDEPAQLNLCFTSQRNETSDTALCTANPFSSLFNGKTDLSTDRLTPEAAKLMSLQGNTYSEILNYCYGTF